MLPLLIFVLPIDLDLYTLYATADQPQPHPSNPQTQRQVNSLTSTRSERVRVPQRTTDSITRLSVRVVVRSSMR
jgi:hypothetical protein